MKKFLLYLVYIIVMFLFICYGSVLDTNIEEATRTFVPNKALVFSTVYPILIGLLLALPLFLSKFSKSGRWVFNLPKFVIVGIPALIGNLSLLLVTFIPQGFSQKLIVLTDLWGYQGVTICGILFGYTLLAVMEKTDSQNIFYSKKHSIYS